MKDNGEIVPFIKQRDYVMVNNALGRGSFGKTVLLQDPFINELFVAKKYENDILDEELKKEFYKNFLDEIKILYKLNHLNVVRIYNYYAYESRSTGYILMEYIDGDNIEDFINKLNPFSFDDNISLDNMFSQLIDGFCYIESQNIIHRDIREGNILIDKAGIVKIIDFGIGKLANTSEKIEVDSLGSKINRFRSDTFPQEYYDKTYTSKTDMFYLAELLNRLIQQKSMEDEYINTDFSYQSILDKMMKKNPNERYSSFLDVREAVNKHDFINMGISQNDKRIYQLFSSFLSSIVTSFIDEQKFNYDVNSFISKLEKTLQNNCFEDYIQNNVDILRSVIIGGLKYNKTKQMRCNDMKNFLNWFKQSTLKSQQLILNNIIAKLSSVKVEKTIDVPF